MEIYLYMSAISVAFWLNTYLYLYIFFKCYVLSHLLEELDQVTVDVFCFFFLLTCYPQVLPLVSNPVYALVITLHHFFHHFFRMCRHALLFDPAFCLSCKTRKQPVSYRLVTASFLNSESSTLSISANQRALAVCLYRVVWRRRSWAFRSETFVVWLHFFLSHSVTKSYVKTYHTVPWTCTTNHHPWLGSPLFFFFFF